MKTFILAGGRGTRLATVISAVPKPMAPVSGRPFLEYVVRKLVREGFTDLVMLTGYKDEVIRAHFADGSSFGARMVYAHEEEPLGTGGAVWRAMARYGSRDERVLVLNGDTYFDVPLASFVALAAARDASASVALKYVEDAARYGTVELKKGRIATFIEKAAIHEPGLINGGVYALHARILGAASPGAPFSLETAVLPSLAHEGNAAGIPFPGRFIDIGVPDEYRRANEALLDWIRERKRKVVFLDRDGIIVEDRGHPFRHKDLILVDGIVEFLRSMADLGYEFIVVTNQAGIAKGLYSEADYRRFTNELIVVLRRFGVEILDAFYCPHHPDAAVPEYRRDCFDRKPNPGMVLRAAEKHSIDLSCSWMVGDKESDIIELPYLRTAILRGNYDVRDGDRVYSSFAEIAEAIRHG